MPSMPSTISWRRRSSRCRPARRRATAFCMRTTAAPSSTAILASRTTSTAIPASRRGRMSATTRGASCGGQRRQGVPDGEFPRAVDWSRRPYEGCREVPAMAKRPRGEAKATAGDRDPSTKAHVDFSAAMSYGDYLRLDRLLDCQHPRSDQHDEMLFIIIHQATQLWMKLALPELHAATVQLREDQLAAAFKGMARVSRIQAQLIQSWDVLSTLTPADYLSFRDSLGHSSGFQSYQYRLIEFALGNKNAASLEPHRHRPELHATLDAALRAPSLYNDVISLIARRGFAIDSALLHRDFSTPH